VLININQQLKTQINPQKFINVIDDDNEPVMTSSKSVNDLCVNNHNIVDDDKDHKQYL
jgi:hypothetical protein